MCSNTRRAGRSAAWRPRGIARVGSPIRDTSGRRTAGDLTARREASPATLSTPDVDRLMTNMWITAWSPLSRRRRNRWSLFGQHGTRGGKADLIRARACAVRTGASMACPSIHRRRLRSAFFSTTARAAMQARRSRGVAAGCPPGDPGARQIADAPHGATPAAAHVVSRRRLLASGTAGCSQVTDTRDAGAPGWSPGNEGDAFVGRGLWRSREPPLTPAPFVMPEIASLADCVPQSMRNSTGGGAATPQNQGASPSTTFR